jgi:hypothetical protein
MSRLQKYSYYRPPFYNQTDPPFVDENLPVENVENAFSNIRTRGEYMAVWDGDKIPYPKYMSADFSNQFGVNNHFQGIQRLRNSNYLVISGGDVYARRGHILIVKLGSRGEENGWRSNLIQSGYPPNTDTILKVIGVNSHRVINQKLGIKSSQWHAGGISILGDILAVPVEGSKQKTGSKILFYNLREPEQPHIFPFAIDRPGIKASAVALTKLPNGYYLLAVLVASDKFPDHEKKRRQKEKGRYLDFYISKTTDFREGFREKFTPWDVENVKNTPKQDKNFSNFQNINFITQKNDNKLYLVGLHNNSPAEPILPFGRDYADLYTVEFDANLSASVFDPDPDKSVPIHKIKKVANKNFYCHDRQCNFDAGAGVYADSSGALIVYSCFHFIEDRMIKFNEYLPNPGNFAERNLTDMNKAWIELFEHENFDGRWLSIRGEGDSTLKDYRQISVRRKSFNDKVSSARFQIPNGKVYRLFQDRDFKGKSFVLEGTGEVEEIQDLKDFKKRDFGDEVSSSKFDH